jgi:hypothetical protein
MNRFKNLIMCAGLAACVAVSLAAATPASAVVVYFTDFNGAPTGTQPGATPLAWTTGTPVNAQNDWGSTANAVVTNAPIPPVTVGNQYVNLDSTFADLGASINSPTFTSMAGCVYTLTVDVWNPAATPSAALLDAAATQPAKTTLTEAFTTPVPTGSSVETISWIGTASDFSFAIGDLGTTPIDITSVTLTCVPTPEASTVIGLGVMLALGGLFMVVSRKRSTGSNLAF